MFLEALEVYSTLRPIAYRYRPLESRLHNRTSQLKLLGKAEIARVFLREQNRDDNVVFSSVRTI